MEKRIRVTQIATPPGYDGEHLKKKACRISGIRPEDVKGFEIVRQSIDARDKNALKYVYSVDLITGPGVRRAKNDPRVREIKLKTYEPEATGTEPLCAPAAVVGSGPAGLFCALLLAQNGYRPVVFERGRAVEERTKDVERFWNGGALDPESNVQFGEGGAGTFSDGKLNTSVRDGEGRDRFVLESFVRFGAPRDILYLSLPHIGTDILRSVAANMREEIKRLGGTFRFSCAVKDIETVPAGPDGGTRLTALITEQNGVRERFTAEAAVFAIGHSARDTFAMLKKRGAKMCPKPFAVGMRVEHPQEMIDRSRYGDGDLTGLPPASYKLTYRAGNGRSVYTFCMCPGGYVVNASSEEGRTAVNGMSYRARDAQNANSAVIVSVTPEDFPDPSDPLSGTEFQRELEERAYRAGGGKIPQQRFGDFESDNKRDGSVASPSRFESSTKGAAAEADLTGIFPDELKEAFIEGMHAFSREIEGFDREDAVLSAVESRTSSPVRIIRDKGFESNISGLYPCGEGAGYAGGIMSAAMDGLKAAEAVMRKFAPDSGGK